jgi:trans-aconitate methyltransferase
MDGFKAGEPQLLPFEVDELGPLEGRLLHLQCHAGLDTLDLARLHPTLEVTGVDADPHAVEAALELAREVRLDHRATFIYSDVLRAADVLDHRQFDVLYTGKGALNQLPHLDLWAGIVDELIGPGGVLYCTEYHPAVNDDQPPISEVITAVVEAGLAIELFHEWTASSARVGRGGTPVRYSLKAVRNIRR